LDTLVAYGSKLAFYVSFVPVEKGTEPLAPTEAQRLELERTLEGLRQQYPSLIFLSFPGDEQHMGGCLAAGRGFFHINAHGAAEACPFAPYSDRSLKTHTLLEVLQSPFFKRLKDAGLVGGEHDGGCALFQHEAEVKALLME
jgi:MoaA/NifB/PqqE/SkfB family radical SAM enzyme